MSHGRTRSRIARLTLLGVGACLATAGSAQAQAVATATPNQPGTGTRLHWAVDGTVAPVASRIPSALTMSAPPGFVLDGAAITARCKPLEAKLDECPANSRIGSALMTIRVFKPKGPDDLPVDIKLFMGPGDKVMAVAFLAGVRVVPGRIGDSDGIDLVFDPLPVPPVIPEVSYEFVGVTVDLGVTRRVTTAPKRKGADGKAKRKKGRTVRVALVRTPTACPTAGWASTATLEFPDGTSAAMQAPIACSG
jgi:hypothetical protein